MASLFDRRVKADGTYVLKKVSRQHVRGVLYFGDLYTFSLPSQGGTFVGVPFSGGSHTVPLWPPMMHFTDLGVTFVKSRWRWSGKFASDVTSEERAQGGLPAQFTYVDEGIEQTGGALQYVKGEDRNGFQSNWQVYIHNVTSDLEASAIITGLVVKSGINLTGVDDFTETDRWSYQGTFGSETQGLVFASAGTTFGKITKLFRALMVGRGSVVTNHIPSPSTWNGFLFDYADRDLLPAEAINVALAPKTPPNPSLSMVVCNRFRTHEETFGRILPGTTEILDNAILIRPESISVEAGGSVESLSLWLRYPPMYSRGTVSLDINRQKDPTGSGAILILDAGGSTGATSKNIPQGYPTINKTVSDKLSYDVRATDGTGTTDYEHRFTFTVDGSSDVYERDSIGLPVTSEEVGAEHIILSANTVQVTSTQRSRSITLYLSTAPPSPVTITVTKGRTELPWTHSPTSFTFNSTNFSTPQTFTVATVPLSTDPVAETEQGDGEVTYTFTASASSGNPYNNVSEKTCTFAKNRNLEGNVLTVGMPVENIPGANYLMIGEDGDQLVTGKYYIEELERDLIADTITVTMKGAIFDDEQLDKYTGQEEETVANPVPKKVFIIQFIKNSGVGGSNADRVQIQDPDDDSITEYEIRSAWQELFAHNGGWDGLTVRKLSAANVVARNFIIPSYTFLTGSNVQTITVVYQVRAINEYGAGPWSDVFTFTT